jgi:hypothetical protein
MATICLPLRVQVFANNPLIETYDIFPPGHIYTGGPEGKVRIGPPQRSLVRIECCCSKQIATALSTEPINWIAVVFRALSGGIPLDG